jgi:hypothetical protein
MDRRFFLKLTGFAAAVGAVDVTSVAAWGRPAALTAAPAANLPPAMQAPGTYQITGRVRLEQPLVEISGIANAQQISWSGVAGSEPPVAGFTSFEHFDQPWSAPRIQVRGGQLEALAVLPLEIA